MIETRKRREGNQTPAKKQISNEFRLGNKRKLPININSSAKKQKINNTPKYNQDRLDNVFKFRKTTFIDAIVDEYMIDTNMLQAKLTYKGKIQDYINIDLNLPVYITSENDKIVWSCLLYFQFIDMIHDHPSTKSIRSKQNGNFSDYSPFDSWYNFCRMLSGSNMYNKQKIEEVHLFVRNIIEKLFKDKNTVKRHKQNGLFGLNNPGKETHSYTEMLQHILEIMILQTHHISKGYIVLMKSLKERTILIDVLKYISTYGASIFTLKKQDVQTRVKGMFAYEQNPSQKHNALMSLDMTSDGRLKDFGGNYYKYVHTVNLGDAGLHYLPERNVRRIISNIIKKDDSIIDRKPSNTNNIKWSTNKNKNNNNNNNKTNEIHSLHYDDTPLKMTFGEMKVYVLNEYMLPNPSDNQQTTGKNFGKTIFNPKLVYVGFRDGKYNMKSSTSFQTSKSLNSNRTSFTNKNYNNPNNNLNENTMGKINYGAFIKDPRYGMEWLYQNLLSKHLGDFLNSANCIHHNIIFGSGDKFACLGYVITYILLCRNNSSLKSKLFWDDATNDQVVYVSSPDDKFTDHFDKINLKAKTTQTTNSSTQTINSSGQTTNAYTQMNKNLLNKQLLNKPPNVVNNLNSNKTNRTLKIVDSGDPVLMNYLDNEYKSIFEQLGPLGKMPVLPNKNRKSNEVLYQSSNGGGNRAFNGDMWSRNWSGRNMSNVNWSTVPPPNNNMIRRMNQQQQTQ
jgi:hypothetical protein